MKNFFITNYLRIKQMIKEFVFFAPQRIPMLTSLEILCTIILWTPNRFTRYDSVLFLKKSSFITKNIFFREKCKILFFPFNIFDSQAHMPPCPSIICAKKNEIKIKVILKEFFIKHQAVCNECIHHYFPPHPMYDHRWPAKVWSPHSMICCMTGPAFFERASLKIQFERIYIEAVKRSIEDARKKGDFYSRTWFIFPWR